MADEAKLVAVIEARTAQFEKALKKIETQTDKTFRRTADSSRRMDAQFRRSAGNVVFLDRSMQSLGRSVAGIGRGLIAGSAIGGILSLTGAINKARDAVRQFDQIADQAAATGLDTDFFQGIVFGAKEAGVSQDRLNDALVTFGKNAGLAAQGKGRMVAALKALNPELLRAIQNADSQAERLRILADALATETDASTRAAIGAATLGDAWDELLPVFQKGAQGLDNLVARAREMGVIVPPEMLRNAGELEDKLNALSFIIDQNLNQALVTLAPHLVTASEAAASLAKSLNEIIGPAQRAVEALNETRAGAAALRTAIDPLGFWRAMAAGMSLFGDEAQESIERLPRLRSEIAEIEARIGTLKEGFGEGIFTEQAIAGDVARLRTLKEEVAAIEQGIRDAKDADLAPRPVPVQPRPLPPAVIVDEEAERELERQKETVAELIADLQFELEQLSRNAEEQEVANAMRRAGAAATEEQRATIENLVRSIQREEAAQEALATAQEQAAERAAQAQEEAAERIEEAQREAIQRMDDLRTTAGGLLSAFNDELFRTGNLMDAVRAAAQELQRVLLRIAEEALISALLGPQGTPAGGILGALFGGGSTASPRITLPVSVQPIAAPGAGVAAPIGAVSARSLPFPPGFDTGLRTFGTGLQNAGRELLEFVPGLTGANDSLARSAELIRGFEGFRSNAYWDVNAFRTGFGSDTTTDAMGAVRRVTQETTTTLADANRDLIRRIGEFQDVIEQQIGPDAWMRLSPNAQASLSSVAYNYGRLPNSLIPAAQSGDPNAIAQAIQGLAGDNGGINAARRMAEAQNVLADTSGQLASQAQTLSSSLTSVSTSVAQTAGQFSPQFTQGLFNLAQTVQSTAPAFGSQFQQALQSVIASIPAGPAGAAQSGQLFSFLSSIGYGGLFAHGGRLASGKWGIAGERGPELVFGPSTIVPPRLVAPHERQRERRGEFTQHNTFVVPGGIDNARSQNQVAARSAAAVQRAVRTM